jgi:Ca2+-binding RTX toxin-like protein
LRRCDVKKIATTLAAAVLIAAGTVVQMASPAAAQEFTKCSREDATIVGTPGDDVIEGTDGRDIILGLGGDDRIVAGGETYSEYHYDRICGGPGDDVLFGHQEPNGQYLETEAIVDGGPGNDRLVGGIHLYGGPGNDELRGEEGGDTLYGGPGNDIIDGGEPDEADFYAADTATFRDGPVTADLVTHKARGEGRDRLIGIENLIGTMKDDILRGDEDRNSIDGRGGGDRLLGRGGDDAFGVDGSEGDPEGLDKMSGGGGTDLLGLHTRRGVEVNLARGTVKSGGGITEKIDGIENVIGSYKRDVLIGDGHANMLDGYDGRDVIKGGGGGDHLIPGTEDDFDRDKVSGGPGDDLLESNRGDDVLDGDEGDDTASFRHTGQSIDASLVRGDAEGSGHDELIDIENLVGSGRADTLEGDARPNRLSGLGGDDNISGNDGADSLDGGDGNDTLDGGAGTDECVNGEVPLQCEGVV